MTITNDLNKPQPLDSLDDMALAYRLGCLSTQQLKEIFHIDSLPDIINLGADRIKNLIKDHANKHDQIMYYTGDIVRDTNNEDQLYVYLEAQDTGRSTHLVLNMQEKCIEIVDSEEIRPTGKTCGFDRTNQYILDNIPIFDTEYIIKI